jgi:hypothetical protein
LIIVMVEGNDVWDWLRIGAPDVYAPPPVLVADSCFICPGRQFSWNARGSAINQIRKEVRVRVFKPTRVRHNTGRWVAEARAMRAQAKEIRHSVDNPESMLANFAINFRELLQNAGRHSHRVMIALQPWFAKELYTDDELVSPVERRDGRPVPGRQGYGFLFSGSMSGADAAVKSRGRENRR